MLCGRATFGKGWSYARLHQNRATSATSKFDRQTAFPKHVFRSRVATAWHLEIDTTGLATGRLLGVVDTAMTKVRGQQRFAIPSRLNLEKVRPCRVWVITTERSIRVSFCRKTEDLDRYETCLLLVPQSAFSLGQYATAVHPRGSIV